MKQSERSEKVEAAFGAFEGMTCSPRVFPTPLTDARQGSLFWSSSKSFWHTSMALAAIVGGTLTFSWDAVLLFLITTIITACLGHSVGLHRLMVHRSFEAPLWVERTLVYLGVLVGMGGPFGVIRIHDVRDWAQRQSECHPYFAHRTSLLRDALWQLHCEFRLENQPDVVIEKRFANDRFYQFLEHTWMLQQLPWALLFYSLGGMGWVIWGIAVRVAAINTGHWLMVSLAHRAGAQPWEVNGAGVQGHNIPYASLITMGEAHHNNHHAFPMSARHAHQPGELDPGWWAILGLKKLGLAHKILTPEVLPKRAELIHKV